MNLPIVIDHGVPDFGEYDSIFYAGGSTIVQSTAAAYPERGATGVRVSTTVGNTAYAQKNISITVAPGGSIFVGNWLCLQSAPADYTFWMHCLSSGDSGIYSGIFANSKLYAYTCTVGGGYSYSPSYTLDDNLHYVAIEGLRASADGVADGRASLYVDEALIGDSPLVDNYDELHSLDLFKIGCSGQPRDNFVLDFDETHIGRIYPEPYRRTQQGIILAGAQDSIVRPQIGGYRPTRSKDWVA